MNKRTRRIAASLLAAAFVITNNPVTLFARENDASGQDILIAGEALLEDSSASFEALEAEHLSEDASIVTETTGDLLEALDENTGSEGLAGEDLTAEDLIPLTEGDPVLSGNSAQSSLSANEADDNGVWDGEIPEEFLNYQDIDITIEKSEIGYDIPGQGRKGNTLFSNDRLSIPSSYRTEDALLPTVKDQRPFATCWSFASMVSCEVSYAKKYGVRPNTIDLSERAFCYFFYNLKGINDPLEHTLGDYQTVILGSDHDIYERGGNVMLASVFLANWGTAIAEDKAPYSKLLEIGTYGDLTTDVHKGADALDDSLCYDPEYHVQNVRFINADDMDGIKRAIMDNGIVARSFYRISSCYNSDYFSYNSGSTYKGKTNHAITVIGWDDDFPRDNFTKKPDNNGAWLIRNSWGTGSDDGGYFWISYDDMSLNNVVVISCEEKENYDRNYFYDGTACLSDPQGGTGKWKAANVFTADGNELLKAVSIAMSSADVPYSIQIYKNPTDPSNPESGMPMLETPVTGTTSYPGYYTIPLGEMVPLSMGETFAVVFTLSEDDRARTSAYIEKSCTIDGNNKWLEFTAETQEGQSFFGREGKKWYDMNAMGACFRIHAYTDKYSMLTLSKSILDINCAFDDKSDTLEIKNGYDLDIDEVTVLDAEGFKADFIPNGPDRSGTLKVTYTGKNANKSFDARLKIVINGFTPIYKQVRINVNNTAPSVSMTWLDKVDHLYVPDMGAGELMVTLNTGRIRDIKLVDSNNNGKTKGFPNTLSYTAGAPVIDADGSSAVIKIKDIPGSNPKFNKARLDVYVESLGSPISKEISISNFKSNLKPSTRNAVLLTDGTAVLEGNKIELGIKNLSLNRAESFSLPTVEITDNSGTSLAGRYSAIASGDFIVITPTTGMGLSSLGEKINIRITDPDHAGDYVISNFKVNALNTGKMSISLGKSSINTQYYEGRNDLNKGLIYSTPLSIKGCMGLNDYIDAGLSAVEGTNDKSRAALLDGHLQVKYDKTTGLVNVSYPGGDPPAAGSYRYKLMLPKSYTGGSKDAVAYLNVNVKKLDRVKAESSGITVKGKFDVINRSGAVSFKPNFNNLPDFYRVTGVELTGDNADFFTLTGFDDTGLANVTLKDEKVYSTRVKYKLGFKYTIAVGDGSITSVTPIKNISMSQGKVTLNMSGINHFGESGTKQEEELIVKACNGNGARIDIKDITLLNPNSDFRLVKQEGSRYFVRYSPNGAVKRGGSYTLKLQVTLKDKAENMAPASCNYKVTVAK